MLALRHRICDRLDLGFGDSEWIQHLTPHHQPDPHRQLQHFDKRHDALYLWYAQGAIRFHVAACLLGLPNESDPATGFAVAPVAEVLARKLYYRGFWALRAQDLFDWRMVEDRLPAQDVHAPAIALLLASRLHRIERSLHMLGEDADGRAAWHELTAPRLPDFSECVAWGLQRLREYRAMHEDQCEADHAAARDPLIEPAGVAPIGG